MTSVQRNWGGDKVVVDDDGDWNGQAVRSTVVRRTPAGTDLATDRVEAYTHCPHCGTEAFHSMRAPRPMPEFARTGGDRFEKWLLRMEYQFRCLPIDFPPKLLLHEEIRFEVIRTCECGAEWGQK